MIRKSKNFDLKRHNTFGMKVKAALFLEYSSENDLRSVPWDELPRPLMCIGSGSNLLFTGDFPGTLLHSKIKFIEEVESRCSGDDVFVRVGSGVEMDDFCAWASGKDLWGVENLSAIPGTVGASAVQNVGAYGVEAGDVIDSVECFEPATGCFVNLSAADCAFAYRDSYFKHNRGRYIVTAVVYHLYSDLRPRLDYGNLREAVERNIELYQSPSDPYSCVYDPKYVPQMPLSVSLVRETVKIIREEKLPDPSKIGSAGSFFKNPVVPADVYERVVLKAQSLRGSDVKVPHFDLDDSMVKIPAAWLIDCCGLKGASLGGASLWPTQPLVIVNTHGEAEPEDILALEAKIVSTVESTFGITLTPEVDHI